MFANSAKNYKLNSLIHPSLTLVHTLSLSALLGVSILFAGPSIQVGSGSLNSAGNTVTLTMTGFSGTLSCAWNACTGVEVDINTGSAVPVMPVTVSVISNQIVIVLAAQVFSTDSVTVNLGSGSNLTDSAGNSAAGQPKFEVVNNSTLAGNGYQYDDSRLFFLGEWNAAFGDGSPPQLKSVGNNSALSFRISCTASCAVDFDMLWDQDAKIYVDNLDPATSVAINATNIWGLVTGIRGLPAGTHLISLTQWGYGMSVATRNPGQAVRVSNGTVVATSFYSTQLNLAQAPQVRTDGGPYAGPIGDYSHGLQWFGGGSGVRFRAAVTDITLWGYWTNTGALLVYQDGNLINLVSSLGPNGVYSAQHVASGLDGAAHDYECVPIFYNGVFSGGGWIAVFGMFPGAGLLPQGVGQAPRKIISCYGDSICLGSGINDERDNTVWAEKTALNSAMASFGYAGQKVTGSLMSSDMIGGPPDITHMSTQPNVVIVTGGTNDQNTSQDQGSYQSAEAQMLSNLVSQMGLTGATKLLVRGILPTDLVNRSPYQIYQAAGVATFNTTSTCTLRNICAVFYSTDGWINTTSDLADGTHPSISGQRKIANRETPILAGYLNGSSYTVSGPASGAIGQPSTFAIALPPTISWTGDQTITVDDGGAAGIFSPSGTLRPPAGSSSYTFSYTPHSAFTTLGFTNGQQGWIDPPSLLLFAPALAPALAPAAVDPGSGSGASQTFTFIFTDPNGYQDLSVVNVLINSGLNGQQACYLAFVPSRGPFGVLFLVDDAGDAGGPFQSLGLPGSGQINNAQCTISGSGNSVTGSGNNLTLTLAIRFSTTFTGNKVFYLSARDAGFNNSGWQALGTWAVPGSTMPGPQVGGVSPARSNTFSQTYTFTFADSNGWQDISVTNILINGGLDGRHACYLAFLPSSPTSGSVLLVDDTGDAGGPFSDMVLPGSGTVNNSRCTIVGAGSSVSGSGNTLILTLAMTFDASFAGNQIFYLATRSNTANSNLAGRGFGDSALSDPTTHWPRAPLAANSPAE